MTQPDISRAVSLFILLKLIYLRRHLLCFQSFQSSFFLEFSLFKNLLIFFVS